MASDKLKSINQVANYYSFFDKGDTTDIWCDFRCQGQAPPQTTINLQCRVGQTPLPPTTKKENTPKAFCLDTLQPSLLVPSKLG
jgi:hypothetical protein